MKGNDYERMYIIDTPCYRCQNIAKVAVIALVEKNDVRSRGPKDFSMHEIVVARKYGVVLHDSFSKTMNETYLANICASCGVFFGEHFLFTGSLMNALYEELEYIVVDI